jgi:hypothetical protein
LYTCSLTENVAVGAIARMAIGVIARVAARVSIRAAARVAVRNKPIRLIGSQLLS